MQWKILKCGTVECSLIYQYFAPSKVNLKKYINLSFTLRESEDILA